MGQKGRCGTSFCMRISGNFQDIDITVELWQGEADAVVPPSHGHYQAESLVNGRAMFLPEEGHFSLPVNHMNEMLCSLLDR